MRSVQLQSALTDYVEAAAGHLQAEVEAGAEVPFEIGSAAGRSGRGRPPLYCYRALTSAFISEREPALRRLPGYADAAKRLERFDGLERYLARRGADVKRATRKARAGMAMRALLQDVFAEQTDFHVGPGHVEAALQRLEQAAVAGPSQLTLLATLHGVVISASELQLGKGLTIAHPEAIEGVPQEALADLAAQRGEGHLLVLHSIDEEDPVAGQARGLVLLRELLRALRLFGDGRVTLGALGWVRLATGAFNPIAVGTGGRPHGALLVSAEQEDELRAFCSLVARRTPTRGEVAWALRRFELGCDRDSAREALSDHLLALRALLEPEGPASGLLAGRVAALCATPAERAELTQRVLAAIELERAIIAGGSVSEPAVRALGEELAAHLRALLSDVICGHLDADLAALADELLLADADCEDADCDDADEGEHGPLEEGAEECEGRGDGGAPTAADDAHEADDEDEAHAAADAAGEADSAGEADHAAEAAGEADEADAADEADHEADAAGEADADHGAHDEKVADELADRAR